MGRALCLAYGLAALPLTLLLMPLLPAIAVVNAKVTGRRGDPWWPVVAWVTFVATLPRLAETFEPQTTGSRT